MQSLHDIKKRIQSIGETGQITKAMQLISVAKMRKANEKYELNARYFDRVRATLEDILAHTGTLEHPYLVPRKTDRAAYVVIASDTGMAGEYNHRVLNFALEEVRKGNPEKIYTIGFMARDFFERNGLPPDAQFLYSAQDPTLSDARRIMMYLVDLFDSKKVDRVYIIYTRHEKTGNRAAKLKLLPLEATDFDDIRPLRHSQETWDFEPDPKTVFDLLVPQCVLGLVYSTLTQSVRCEHAERQAAMQHASDNASEMLNKLELEFHRARQAAITTEIAEISAAGINRED